MVFVIHSFILERLADPQSPTKHCGQGYKGDSHGSSPHEAHRVVRVTLLPAHLGGTVWQGGRGALG